MENENIFDFEAFIWILTKSSLITFHDWERGQDDERFHEKYFGRSLPAEEKEQLFVDKAQQSGKTYSGHVQDRSKTKFAITQNTQSRWHSKFLM